MTITPDVIASFRVRFQAFSDLAKWPDDILEMALCDANSETGGRGWGIYQDDCGNFKQRGMFLWTAHYLTVFYPSSSGAENPEKTNKGGSFAVAGKSVGDESITFNNGSLSSESSASGSAWYSTTNYGQQFLMLRRRAGMGARAV